VQVQQISDAVVAVLAELRETLVISPSPVMFFFFLFLRMFFPPGEKISLKKEKQMIGRVQHQVGRHNMTVDSSTYFRRATFSSQLKAKVGSTLAKAPALRVNLNIDGTTITSTTHTHWDDHTRKHLDY
jgi:hypothetical protein